MVGSIRPGRVTLLTRRLYSRRSSLTSSYAAAFSIPCLSRQLVTGFDSISRSNRWFDTNSFPRYPMILGGHLVPKISTRLSKCRYSLFMSHRHTCSKTGSTSKLKIRIKSENITHSVSSLTKIPWKMKIAWLLTTLPFVRAQRGQVLWDGEGTRLAAEGHGRGEKGHPDHLGRQEAGDCRQKNTEGDDNSGKLRYVD